jgi:aryl-alcohol dehydrogenase-like predicted oxidoreductase/predicted kinase/histidinol phosphatase-like enzyme
MRMSTDEDRDEQRALETIAAAADAGITVFDTARSYGRDESELGHNERLLARALRACGAAERARVVTKGGMARTGGGWVADGRAKSIRRDCEASLDALNGLPIDLYLLHAPDPRTAWATSLRALGRLLDDGLVRHVGVANVSRTQLDEAVALTPVSAVQVALGPFADRALRGGIVSRCEEAGLAVIAHTPLGGKERAGRLARDPVLAEVAAAHDASPAEVALAWLLDVSPAVVPIPGARRPETARSAAAAAALALSAAERRRLSVGFGVGRPARRKAAERRDDAEVVLVVGIPGAGKTRAAEQLGRGYVRLNRDERGGSLRALAEALDDTLGSGARRVVLDNTYLTRAARSHAIETAARHNVPARCVWIDTPLAQAQVNLVERLLDRFGALPSPGELRVIARREPGLLLPTSQMRAVRELEPPALDEGLSGIERVDFVREANGTRSRPGVFVAAAAAAASAWRTQLADHHRGAPHLVFDWSPEGRTDVLDAAVEQLSVELGAPVTGALCPHGAGPPICWCRPPLPGLLLAFVRAQGVDPTRSVLVGTSPAHKTLAATLGARYLQAS